MPIPKNPADGRTSRREKWCFDRLKIMIFPGVSVSTKQPSLMFLKKWR